MAVLRFYRGRKLLPFFIDFESLPTSADLEIAKEANRNLLESPEPLRNREIKPTKNNRVPLPGQKSFID